jgi:hypothetical protein
MYEGKKGGMTCDKMLVEMAHQHHHISLQFNILNHSGFPD